MSIQIIHSDTYPAISPKNFRYKGEIALITGTYFSKRYCIDCIGAGRGIGKSIALSFAESGADVALLSRTKSELEQVATQCEKFGVKTIIVTADATNEEQVIKAVKRVPQSKRGN